MMKGQFKSLNEKLDTLLESSKTSSNTAYSYESVKSLIETFTKEHAKSLDASTKAVENSEKINQFLLNLIDTRDSLLTVSVRQHLTDKLKPVFSMLNHIEGVSESSSLPKQGEKSRNQLMILVNKNINQLQKIQRYGKPEYQNWSSNKITVVKVIGPIKMESFINAKFKVVRGAKISFYEFTLKDLLCLNPYDWISLFHLLLQDKQKFKPLVAHLKRMLISYIHGVMKMDVEIATILQKKPTFEPKESPNDVTKMSLGKIEKDNLSVTFQQSANEGSNFKKFLFSLSDKHLYSTSCLNYIVVITGQCKVNDVATKKCFIDMIKWYILVPNTSLGLMSKLFKVQKSIQH
ncbi:unnamed protein product [Lactuca saligna]|uniref:Uncharacterized protein n=1 Tax=Lactuca saligna TaxID=75948 RepID=A0AA35YVJ1_LACSI|nr:unnamed protein product [Lactuca saligna]